MSLAPGTPIFTQNLQGYTPKSFWKRPEGPFGMVVLVALIVGAGVGLYVILPFLITLLTNTLYAIGLTAMLIAILWLVFNRTFRTAVKNLFQSMVRWFASWVVETDPIGILRNNLDDMKKEKANLDQTLQRFAGSDERLQRSIAAKNDEINTLGHKGSKAEQMAAAAKDPMERERLMLERQTFLEKAGMLMQGVKQLQALQEQTARMLSTFQHWSQIADSKIQRTENKVAFLAEQRKMILDAKATLGIGQRLLRGSPEQLKMVDMALEYLEDDTSRTLGEIREFSRYTDKLLSDEQIESGAAADEAAARFAEFNQKLLTAGKQPAGADIIHIPGMGTPEPESIPGAPATGQSVGEYGHMFYEGRLNFGRKKQMARLKPQAKVVLIVILAGGVVFGLRSAMQHGWIPTPGVMQSVIATRVELPPQTEAQVANVQALPYPSTVAASVSATRMTFDIWEWNAMFALLYANGGKETTKGSLMEKNGVNLVLHREDSNSQMKADLLACAKQLHDGEKTCSSGAAALVVMGDGGGQWLADLNPQLKRLGPEYQAVIIGAVGRSNGEDALLGPAEWKSNPQSMKGKTVVGVIRDGDWNIALNYMGSNGLKNNPDLKTYDPDAVNWISAPDEDYIKAVTEVYLPNRCEDRKVVKNGRPTGETTRACPDGVVTWTPGDEQAVHGRPGTTKIVSSHEYASQMPAVIIGIKKFFNDSRDEVHGLLGATFQAADQLKAFDAARRKAGDISAKIYNDQNGAYWYNYYTGVRDPKTNQPLGGSAVFNLEDNVNYFGLDGKHNNNMRATYETFGRIATQNYPQLFKDNPIPSYKEAVDTSFIFGAQALLNSSGVQSASAETVDYAKEAAGGTVVGHKAVYINFATGSDQPLSSSLSTLNELKDALAINSQLALQVDGYTDNTGSDTVNVPLSQKRALAVKRYFQQMAPLSFPETRFKSVSGHGSESPLASNATEGGKALNRRVEITQIGQ